MSNFQNERSASWTSPSSRTTDSNETSRLRYSRYAQDPTRLKHQTQGQSTSYFGLSKRHSNAFSDTDALKQIRGKHEERTECEKRPKHVSVLLRESRFRDKYGVRKNDLKRKLEKTTSMHKQMDGIDTSEPFAQNADRDTKSFCDSISLACSSVSSTNASRPTSQEYFSAARILPKRVDVKEWLYRVSESSSRGVDERYLEG